MSAVETLITTPDRALLDVPVGDVIPSPDNRTNMGDLQGLAASIADRGVLVPLIVAPHPKHAGKWDLIAGERRLRASIMVGLDTVPCIVRRLAPAERDEDRLVENLHRKDLDPIEEAAGYQLLVDRHGYTQTQVAEKMGRSQAHVSKRLSLLRLPDAVLDELRPHDETDDDDGDETGARLTLEDAYALTALADHPQRILEAMNGFAPGDRYKTSVGHAVRRHVEQIEWANLRAKAAETLARRRVRVVEPDLPPRGRYAVSDACGVKPLGKGWGEIDVAVGVHARHHADHHVAVVLETGEIVYGCDRPKDHDKAAKAKVNGKATGDQLQLVARQDEDAARKAADDKAWAEATAARRDYTAGRLAAVRPKLGETILHVLPALLHQLQQAPLKTACRLLDLTPDGTAYREVLEAAVPDGDATEAARVLLALMAAIAEDTATQTWGGGPSRWLTRDHVAAYYAWLADNGYQPTDIEDRATAGELDR